MDKRLEQLSEAKKLDIVDGEHQMICCSNCDTELVDLWVTKPDPTIKFKLRAECAWCRDFSYDTIVTGKFHLGATESCNIITCDSLSQDEAVLSGEVMDSFIIRTGKEKGEKTKRKSK